jgi:hypothetical protein
MENHHFQWVDQRVFPGEGQIFGQHNKEGSCLTNSIVSSEKIRNRKSPSDSIPMMGKQDGPRLTYG